MIPAEVAVLRILADASGPFSWYAIERRLSNVALSDRPHLPKLLGELVARGLVQVADPTSDTYSITARGREALSTLAN